MMECMSNLKPLFEKQAQHLVWLALLLAGVAWIARGEEFQHGSYLGISTSAWFWWSIALPVIHQVWVATCWRLELHHQALSRSLGDGGFRLYAAGFAFWSAGRFLTLIPLALANQGTVEVGQRWLNALAIVITVPTVYLFYSVARYFGFRRALGIDHFDPSYRQKPFVRKGIFRFTRNGMYTVGFGAIWLPGLLCASQAALLSAAFSHLYIWVHYFCTELPDMRRIYGEA